uniref:GDP-D-glucose phosphorylase 1 n=1 Tax=Bursaphelenchus xylophilus TaxID=6326 RepID=A0A1I7SCT3_BURXY
MNAADVLYRARRSHSTVQPPKLDTDQSTVHVQFFQYKTTDYLYDLRECSSDRLYSDTNFKEKLKNKWHECKDKGGVINYDLNCMYKLLDGDYNLSIQLNVERGTLRRKPMRFQSIVQPFNMHRWNFTKLRPSEVMFYARCTDNHYTNDPLDTHTICVNASPIESGHFLFVPSLSKRLPQIMTETGIRMATDLMLIVEDENFHVLYNSLLGQASLNHLHLHGLFWPYESDLIHRRFELLAGDCYVIRRPDWYIHCFCYQLQGPDSFDSFVKNVWHTLNFLTVHNVAHNMFFTRAPPLRTQPPVRFEQPRDAPSLVTVYIFPRQSQAGAKPMNNFNPAALELAGCLMAYNLKFFETATEQSCIRTFDEDAALDDLHFETVNVIFGPFLQGNYPKCATLRFF